MFFQSGCYACSDGKRGGTGGFPGIQSATSEDAARTDVSGPLLGNRAGMQTGEISVGTEQMGPGEGEEPGEEDIQVHEGKDYLYIFFHMVPVILSFMYLAKKIYRYMKERMTGTI